MIDGCCNFFNPNTRPWFTGCGKHENALSNLCSSSSRHAGAHARIYFTVKLFFRHELCELCPIDAHSFYYGDGRVLYTLRVISDRSNRLHLYHMPAISESIESAKALDASPTKNRFAIMLRTDCTVAVDFFAVKTERQFREALFSANTNEEFRILCKSEKNARFANKRRRE